MVDTDPNNSSTAAQAQPVVDRLVFAALKEQTRARRWRIFFMLFFVVYLSVVTIMMFAGGADDYGAGGKPDGDKHTALVTLSGIILSGETAGAENMIEGLKAAFEHEDTAGIVVEINSPGGSPVQSAYIYDEIMRLKEIHENIPVYAVITDVGASGAYFVAAAADEIYANPSSLIGSIGVSMGSFGVVEMMKKLGIERRLQVAGENKGIADPFLPEQSHQKAHFQTMLDQVHQHFIGAVKQGRGDRLENNPDIFSGLVWSGETALELGLVDAYGNTRSISRDLEAEEIVDFTPESALFERIAERIGVSAARYFSTYLLGNFSLR